MTMEETFKYLKLIFAWKYMMESVFTGVETACDI